MKLYNMITCMCIIASFVIMFVYFPKCDKPWHTEQLPTIAEWQEILNSMGVNKCVVDGRLGRETEYVWNRLNYNE